MELILCPRCEGQTYDLDSCGLCNNLGLLDEDGAALDAARLRELVGWLRAWQGNFPAQVSESEPQVPYGYAPRGTFIAWRGVVRPQGLTG